MTPERIPRTVRITILLAVPCAIPSLRAERGPQFEFRLAGDCGATILGDPGSDYDDGTGGRDFFFDDETFQNELREVPADSPGHTWDVILRTTENPTLGEPEPRGAQGWSWTLATEGALRITDVTTSGSVSCAGGDFSRGPTCLRIDGFEVSEVIGPPSQKPGARCAVVLSQRLPITVPPDLEDAVVAKIRVLGTFPEEAGHTAPGRLFWTDFRATVRVPTIVTFEGRTFTPHSGDPPLKLTDCEVLLEASASGPRFIRGDADGDGRVVVTDVVLGIRVLLGRVPARFRCEDALDVNDDDRSDLSDAVRLLHYLFAGGRAPPGPFPECGVDPGEDDRDDCLESSVFCRDTA